MKNNIPENSLSKGGLREALQKTNEFLASHRLNTVAYISSVKLVRAMENEEYCHLLSRLDLTIFEDVEILKALDLATPALIREVEENKYLKELLRRLAKEQYQIYLVADTEEKLELLEKELKSRHSSLCIIGRSVTGDYPENKESLINTINFAAPKAILSQMIDPMDMVLLKEYGNYLNASLWVILPDKIMENEKTGWLDKINKIMYKKLLNKKINHSKDTEKSSL